MSDIGGEFDIFDFGQVFMIPEARAAAVALSALLGVWCGGIVIDCWRRRKPVELVVPLLIGFIFAVVIPQGLLLVPTSRSLPEAVANPLAVLTIIAPLVWAWGFWSVVYRVVAERYWAWRDKKYGDVWSIETLPDGSTRTHPPRIANRISDQGRMTESVRATLARDALDRSTRREI